MKIPITVEAYAGYRANERPSQFLLDRKLHEIETILARWYEPSESCFKIRTKDGKAFVLRYDEQSDQWSLDTANSPE